MGRSLYGLFLFGIYLWMDFSSHVDDIEQLSDHSV